MSLDRNKIEFTTGEIVGIVVYAVALAAALIYTWFSVVGGAST